MAEQSPNSSGQFLLHQSEDWHSPVESRFRVETLWFSQVLMAELCDTNPLNITLHLKCLEAEEGISETPTCKELLQILHKDKSTVRCGVKHYNLNDILAVGFVVRSPRGVQFRQWVIVQLDMEYRQLLDQQPCEVDKHFADAIRKLDQIEKKTQS